MHCVKLKDSTWCCSIHTELTMAHYVASYSPFQPILRDYLFHGLGGSGLWIILSQFVTLVCFWRSMKGWPIVYCRISKLPCTLVYRLVALYSGLQYTSNDKKCNKTSNSILHVERGYKFSMFWWATSYICFLMSRFAILGLKKLPEQAQTDTKDNSFVMVNYS